MMHFTKRKKIIVSLLFAIGIILVWVGFGGLGGQKKPLYDTVLVTRTDLMQEVNVTGRVEAQEKVDLAFETSGRIARVLTQVGEEARAGEVLVELEAGELRAALSQAHAQVASAQADVLNKQAAYESARAALLQYQAAQAQEEAQLAELKKGTREEEITVAKTTVANAQITLADKEEDLVNVKNKADADLATLYKTVSDTVVGSYTAAEDAVNKQLVDLFERSGSQYKLTFSTSDTQAKADAEAKRKGADSTLATWKSEISTLSTSTPYSELDTAQTNALTYVSSIKSLVDSTIDALDFAVSNAQASPTTLTTYRTSATTARSSMNTEIAEVNDLIQSITSQRITNEKAIVAAESDVNTAQSALELAQDELALKEAGATEEALAAQEAAVQQAKASVASQYAAIKQAEAQVKNAQAGVAQAQAQVAKSQADLAKRVLVAPFDSIVVREDATEGEIVGANSVLITLMSPHAYQIVAYVPEVDIALVHASLSARVTLDAYGSDTIFDAFVVAIDPVEKILDGVATYKTTLLFTKGDERIKSGMTANIDIKTAEKRGVLAVPQRAVIRKNGTQIVRVIKMQNAPQSSNAISEVPVITGLRSTDGLIEIISGVAQGDTVIVSTSTQN